MKVFILIMIIHVVSMAEGLFIYHQFLTERAEEMMYEILHDELVKILVEERMKNEHESKSNKNN